MLKFLDDAINELDNMESVMSSYKIHLNVSYLPNFFDGCWVADVLGRLLMTTLRTSRVKAVDFKSRRKTSVHF